MATENNKKKNKFFIWLDERYNLSGLIEFAKKEVELLHQNTQSTEKEDYPKNITSLCRWRTGKCDFYDRCFSEE